MTGCRSTPPELDAPPVPARRAGTGRVMGVDVARGLALFGMMATHVFDTFDPGGPTVATVLASGRSATMFALLAGVSTAFLSGGREILHGRARRAAAAGLAVRAVVIGLFGLVLGFAGSVQVILVFYALMFLMEIPLLGLRPRALAALSAAFAVLGPVLLVATDRLGLPYDDPDDPTPVSLVTRPLGVLLQLLLNGAYPVVVYFAFVCAGLAIGRLDLRSSRVAWRLLGGGLALAVTARVISLVLLYPLGGLGRLLAEPQFRGHPRAAEILLWGPDQGSSWWYLALSSPHADTPLDAAHVLGSAMAVLGAALLVTRAAPARRLLAPLAAAGAMTLTLYSAHVVVLAVDLFDDSETALYLALVAGSMLFAVLWRRRHRSGPLETVVAAGAGRARRAVLRRRTAPAEA